MNDHLSEDKINELLVPYMLPRASNLLLRTFIAIIHIISFDAHRVPLTDLLFWLTGLHATTEVNVDNGSRAICGPTE